MLYDKRHLYLRAPMRVSFVGGGTDIETYYYQGISGQVISTAIDLYSYVSIKDMFDSNTRIHHSEIETEPITSRIKHSYAKNALEYFGLFKGIEVVLISDVMVTGSGLGASSSMMSALIMGCNKMRSNKRYDKSELAELTYKLEQKAGTIGGKQDQYAAVFGGLNSIEFKPDEVIVNSINLSNERLKSFESRLLLVFTNLARESKYLQIKLTENAKTKKKIYFDKLQKLTKDFLSVLKNENTDINELGKILHEGWHLKKTMNESSTNPYIDQLYELLLSKGVIGGKILGAGGGGFFLAFAKEPELKEKIKYELYPNFISLDIKFNFIGTEILWKNF